MDFQLVSKNKPAGDQPQAIKKLVQGLEKGYRHQTLLGVTGSGKSVTGDTPIFIRDRSENRFTTIGEYVAKLWKNHTLKIVKRGDTHILDASHLNLQTYSFNPKTGKNAWSSIAQVTKHRSPKNLYKVIASCGRTVTTTGDHNFYVLRNGDLSLIKTEEIHKGDFLPIPRTIPNTKKGLVHINLASVLIGSDNTYYASPNPGTAWNSKVLKNLTYQKRYHVEHSGERVKFSDVATIPPRLVRVGVRSRGITFPIIQSVTSRFLRFLGYYVAEGHSTSRYIVISSADKEIIDDLHKEAFARGMSFRHRPNSYDYQCNNLIWTDVLSSWCGTHSNSKQLPPFWPELSNQQLAELLSAYFSADGGVEKNIVSATTTSKRLASDILYALLRFGIVARMKHRMVKVPNKSYRNEAWRIVLSGRDSLIRFQRHIGFTLQRKNDSLRNIMPPFANTNVDIIPINGNDLKSIRLEAKLSQESIAKKSGIVRAHISLMESGLRKPSREVCKKIIATMIPYRSNPRVNVILKKWIALLPLFWTPVARIELSPKTDYVYDFAVEKNETFIAGYGGLFVHNTFTIANVINAVQKPTLVIAHNKTLAAQLCNELRELFPKNAVHYFVSYYDYYQPEAYLPSSDTYIDKEAMINEEIDRLRHAATMSLLTRNDVIVVASVSCIYGLGAPETYRENIFHFQVGDIIERREFVRKLVSLQFHRTTADLKRGTFRLRGDNWEIMPPDREIIYNFSFAPSTSLGKDYGKLAIEKIFEIDPVAGFVPARQSPDGSRRLAGGPGKTPTVPEIYIAPAKHFITEVGDRKRAVQTIKAELAEQLKKFEKEKKYLEAERLERRTKFDIAMIAEVGYCHGIENYSRHLSGRPAGEAPDTLLDYFPRKARGQTRTGTRTDADKEEPDFLTIIDESHVTVSQINGMYNGDAARKKTLIEYGFRLPSAADNRPLTFDEFDERTGQTIYTSATPGNYEKDQSGDHIVEQIIRPTGLVDPKITILPAKGQINDLIPRIEERVALKERVLVTTLTKKMAEDLTTFLQESSANRKSQIANRDDKPLAISDKPRLKVAYLHSDVKTLDRIRILTDLRRGKFDVLVGVNLLREGLDLPEVSLVAILDADKEGFLRSETSLIQTIGRAARNERGEVLMYADNITGSIERAVKETDRRRAIQLAYNKKHGITPKTIIKEIKDILPNIDEILKLEMKPVPKSKTALERLIADKTREMKEAAKLLNFELASILRDEIAVLAKKTKSNRK